MSVGLGIELPFELASTAGSTSASTSGTSSPARPCSSSTPKGSSCCQAVSAPSMSCSRRSLVQTHKVTSFPIVLLGRDYWQGLLDWMQGPVLARKMISAPDLDLLNVTDDVDEAVAILVDSVHQREHEQASSEANAAAVAAGQAASPRAALAAGRRERRSAGRGEDLRLLLLLGADPPGAPRTGRRAGHRDRAAGARPRLWRWPRLDDGRGGARRPGRRRSHPRRDPAGPARPRGRRPRRRRARRDGRHARAQGPHGRRRRRLRRAARGAGHPRGTARGLGGGHSGCTTSRSSSSTRPGSTPPCTTSSASCSCRGSSARAPRGWLLGRRRSPRPWTPSRRGWRAVAARPAAGDVSEELLEGEP